MNESLLELEREGLYTPLKIYRLIQRTAQSFERSQDPDELPSLRSLLKPLLQNRRSQYYLAARALYDRIGLRQAWPHLQSSV